MAVVLKSGRDTRRQHGNNGAPVTLVVHAARTKACTPLLVAGSGIGHLGQQALHLMKAEQAGAGTQRSVIHLILACIEKQLRQQALQRSLAAPHLVNILQAAALEAAVGGIEVIEHHATFPQGHDAAPGNGRGTPCVCLLATVVEWRSNAVTIEMAQHGFGESKRAQHLVVNHSHFT